MPAAIARRSDTDASVPRAKRGWYSHPYNRAAFYRLAGAMGWLPRPARLRLARRLGRLAERFFVVERATVRKTLSRVTGADGSRLDELTAGLFGDFATCFSDLVTTNRQPAAELAPLARVVGIESFPEVGRGLVSLTAHVGNWELAGRLLAARAARPTRVVVTEDEARELEHWVRRNGDGIRFVPRSRPTVSIELVAALRRGEVVAMQGDRALGNRGDVLVDFFGRPAPFPIGPFVLARGARVPVVPAFCLLGPDDRYVVTVGTPIRVDAGGETDALRSWVALLQDIVRRHPTQWFNFFDVWEPSGPAGPVPS